MYNIGLSYVFTFFLAMLLQNCSIRMSRPLRNYVYMVNSAWVAEKGYQNPYRFSFSLCWETRIYYKINYNVESNVKK